MSGEARIVASQIVVKSWLQSRSRPRHGRQRLRYQRDFSRWQRIGNRDTAFANS